MKPGQKRIGIFMAVSLLALSASSPAAPAETIFLSLKAGPCQIGRDPRGFDRVEMEGYRTRGTPGSPLLPEGWYNILLPPDVVWESLRLEVTAAEMETLPGIYEIAPAFPDSTWTGENLIEDWGEAWKIKNGKNLDIYQSETYFPESYLSLEPYSQMRKWKFTRVRFTPLQYHPTQKRLNLIKNVQAEISFTRAAERMDKGLVRDRALDHLAPGMFFNYEDARDWYAPTAREEKTAPTYDYVIITTNAIMSGSGRLSAFVTHKQNRGHSVLVVTEDDFGGLTGQAPNQRAEKIRQWLLNHYIGYGIVYVLLIGDPHPYESGEGDIPMKMCWPRYGSGSYEESPTDCFYADLTGNWDLDGDEYYGEFSDYRGTGGVDFAVEVWVGRIPVYGSDYAALDDILQKMMDYEQESPTSWRQNILLPMSFSASTYDGAPMAEQCKDDYLSARSYACFRQYQQGNGACSLDSIYPSEEELRGGTVVRDRWAAGDYGIVMWWGHGSQTSASVGCDGCWDGTLFSSSYTGWLDDSHPAFTYQCSCTNGYPEHSNNLQYAILKQGGIGTVGATRVSWFNTGVGYGEFDGSSTNSGIGYEYADRLTQNLPSGNALYAAKLAVVPDTNSNTRLMNQFDFNLAGDPSISISAAGPTPTPSATPTPQKTPTPGPDPCAAGAALNRDQAGTLTLLRRVRDEVLWRNPSGQRYLHSYRLHSPEVIALMLKDPELREQIGELLSGIAPVLRSLVEPAAGEVPLSPAQASALDEVIQTMQSRGSPALKAALAPWRAYLADWAGLTAKQIWDSLTSPLQPGYDLEEIGSRKRLIRERLERARDQRQSSPEETSLRDSGAGQAASDVLAVGGDYDGDGTDDIAAFYPDSGLWLIREITRTGFGSTSDLTAPGDYDGDGTTDIATFRPADGLWRMRGITRLHFGIAGDIPRPGDYDGDGSAEIAIFRPATVLWAVKGFTRFYHGIEDK